MKREIATVDFDRTLIPDNQQPVYDGYLSVGNTQNYTIPMAGKEIPINIISYYDKLKDISYDNKNNELKIKQFAGPEKLIFQCLVYQKEYPATYHHPYQLNRAHL